LYFIKFSAYSILELLFEGKKKKQAYKNKKYDFSHLDSIIANFLI